MSQLSQQNLSALGADLPLSDKIINELNNDGFTIIPNMIEPDWLDDMRRAFDSLVDKEGDQLAIEHHQEETATRLANLVNKGIVWEKVWSHPLMLIETPMPSLAQSDDLPDYLNINAMRNQ